MKVVVFGGSGLIGSKLVSKLREDGHEPLAASPEGLAAALEGAHVVVDVADAPAGEDTRNLLTAEAVAGVAHHVTLSVVGADRVPDSDYFRGKLAKEELVEAGPIPYTIVRATPCFELISRIADSCTEGDAVRLPPALVQPVAADDVASTLVDVTVGAALDDTIELAGPEVFSLTELVSRVLTASHDPRQVTADVHARYFGAELNGRSLTPGDAPRIAPTHFEDWLSQSTNHR